MLLRYLIPFLKKKIIKKWRADGKNGFSALCLLNIFSLVNYLEHIPEVWPRGLKSLRIYRKTKILQHR